MVPLTEPLAVPLAEPVVERPDVSHVEPPAEGI